MGDWFKTMVSSKKVKDDGSKKLKKPSASAKSNGFKFRKKGARKRLLAFANGIGMPVEDAAATRIQTAFRAYRARKTLRRLKGMVRLQALTQNNSVKMQSTSSLSYLHSWSKIQAEVRARRVCMVTEGRKKQKKLENQLKLEAKLHDLEVEWNSGAKTMEEILSRIHQREEAAVKRERAMAYAFSHQWRADCNHNHGPGDKELSKANWGWSWKDRWIAARPWESRVPPSISPKKEKSKQPSKAGKNTSSPTQKASVSAKPKLSNGTGMAKPRRLSYPAAVKPAAPKGSIKPEEVNTNKNQPRRFSYPPAEKPAAGKGSVKSEFNTKKGPEKPAARKGSSKPEKVNTKKEQEKPATQNGSNEVEEASSSHTEQALS